MGIDFAENLFFLFYNLTTVGLQLWASILLSAQKSLASRILLISAIIYLPLNLFSSIYWSIWPMGVMESGWSNVDAEDSMATSLPLDTIETITSYLEMVRWIIWAVALVFVGFRYRREGKPSGAA